LGDIGVFRRVTLAFLVAARDLALVSVWNPSFLSLLLDELEMSGDRIADAIESGRLAPLGVDGAAVVALERRLRPSPRRAQLLRAVVHAGLSGDGLRRIW